MIFGMLGFAGSGKGTIGDILVRDYYFKADSYAAPVKDAVAAIFGWNRDILEGDTHYSRTFRETPDPFWSEKFGRPFTPREALQLMGTECGRNVYYSNLWIDALEQRILKDRKYTNSISELDDTDFVITDVRFPNEIAQIIRLGGKIVRVKAGPEPLWFEYAKEWNTVKWDETIPCQANRQVMKDFPGIHYSEFAWIGYPINITIENDGTLEELKNKVASLVDNYDRL